MQPYLPVKEQLDRTRKAKRNRFLTLALALFIVIGAALDARAEIIPKTKLSGPETCDIVGRLSQLIMESRQKGHPRNYLESIMLEDGVDDPFYSVNVALINSAFEVPLLTYDKREAVIHRFIGLQMTYCWEAADQRK